MPELPPSEPEPAERTVEGGPIDPVHFVSPVIPVTAVLPVTTVIPITPVSPVTPVIPVAPVIPVSPIVAIGQVGTPPPQRLPIVLKLPPWATPVAPGAVGPDPVSIDQPTLQAAMVSALGTPYAAVGAAPPGQVIWYDHDGEVLAQLDATVVSLFDGLVLVTITLEAAETGAGQVTAPLVVGSTQQPVGLLVGTERRPRGPLLLVDRWGETATAAAWRALIDVARSLAQQGGADSNGVAFVPAAMTATPQSFSVLPQARQAMDSTVTA